MAYVLRRLALLVLILLVVSFFTYFLINLLPGDPTIAILGPSATPHAEAVLRHQLHLDQPLLVRYFELLGNALTGHLGRSYVNGESVATSISQSLPVTIELLILSQLIALVISVPVGVYSAVRPNKLFDQVATTVSFAGLSVPVFTISLVLVLFFAVDVHLFPATGYTGLTSNPLTNLRSVLLPSVALAVGSIAAYSRILRADMISTLQQDFVTMARAKGLPDWYILFRHALRPSTFTTVTVAGLQLGTLISGAFIVEYIFALPGLG